MGGAPGTECPLHIASAVWGEVIVALSPSLGGCGRVGERHRTGRKIIARVPNKRHIIGTSDNAHANINWVTRDYIR